MKSVLIEADRRLAQLTAAIAVTMFILIPILTTYQILARFVLNDPASWTEAAVRLVKGGYRIAFLAIQIAAILIVLATALYGGVKLLSIIKTQRIAGLGVSMAYAYAAVPFGAGLGILTVVSTLLSNNIQVEDPDSEQALTVSQT
jgi:TRAP-type C4-dicarboxylate transport system permease small subunit